METIANQGWSKTVGRLAELARRLEEDGLPYEALQRPIDDKEMRRRLVRFWASGGFEPSTSQKRAREIMGRDFFGVEEAIKHFGANPSKQQLAAIAEVPFTEETLEATKATHVLVAAFPMSILDVRGKVEHKLFYSHDDAWYNKQAFAKDRGEAAWYLVRKIPVPNSTSKTWDEQRVLLAKNEETPTARVMVYTIIGHFLATGERLFERIYVRCSDLDSGGHRVGVGYFGGRGLAVSDYWDDGPSGGIGLASARKSD